MSVWIRRGAWGLAGLLLILAAAAAWFVATFDANRYKGTAIEWMKTHRDRTLTIDGPIELSVFPRLTVKLSRVSLSEAGGPAIFAALDEAGLAVDVLPLMRGDLVVGRIEAKGVRLNYRRDAQGKSNVDDLLRPAPGPEQPAERKALRFDVSGIALADVQAQVNDEVNAVQGSVQLVSFNAGRLANHVEAPVSVDAQFDFKQPLLKGRLRGDTRLTLDTDTSSIALRDMDLNFKGDAPGATALDAAFKGSVAWDGAKRSVDAQSLALELSGHSAGLRHTGTTLSVERFTFDPARKALVLQRLQARVKGLQGNEPLKLDLDWPELAAAGDKLSGSPFSGTLTRGASMPLEARFTSAAPSGSFDAVRLPAFEVRFQSNAAQRKVAGTLRSDLTLKPTPFALLLDKVDLQAQLDEPKQPALSLAAHGNALASGQRSSWNLSGQLNSDRFTSDGSVILAGDTPQLNAKARFDSLDLNRLLGPASAEAKGSASTAKQDTPIDLSALRSVNGRVGLSAGRFAFRQYRLADARLDAALDAGMLHINELSAKAWGGQVSATAFADARASRIAVKGAASGVNVNALLKDVAAKDWLEGSGRVAWDLDSAGRSVDEMKSHLKGSAALHLRDGAIKGINLAKSLRQAKTALSMKQDAAQKASEIEKTDFSELSASFQIADGVARNRDLDVKSPFLRLGGEGAVDIARSRVDYRARVTVTSLPKGQDAGDMAALKGLTVPVRLSGPFDALGWSIEWSSVAGGVIAKQIENKLGEALGIKAPGNAASQSSPEDTLKKALKGLFK